MVCKPRIEFWDVSMQLMAPGCISVQHSRLRSHKKLRFFLSEVRPNSFAFFFSTGLHLSCICSFLIDLHQLNRVGRSPSPESVHPWRMLGASMGLLVAKLGIKINFPPNLLVCLSWLPMMLFLPATFAKMSCGKPRSSHWRGDHGIHFDWRILLQVISQNSDAKWMVQTVQTCENPWIELPCWFRQLCKNSSSIAYGSVGDKGDRSLASPSSC